MGSNIRGTAALVFLLAMGAAHAIDHPGCMGKDNRGCDTFAALINLKGKLCYRVMKVQPLGGDSYHLTCELASHDRSLKNYMFRFVDGQRNYTVDDIVERGRRK